MTKKICKGNLKPQKVAESRTSTGYQGTRPAATAIEVF